MLFMEKLVHLLKLTQEELKVEVYKYLRQKKMKSIYEDGFVYAEGDIPILLVAHLDTVFDELPKRLFYSKKEDKIFNPDGGLGGDDRCGVYAIMQLLKKYRPHVLFTEDEEIGCIGAEKTVEKLAKPNVKYIIEFDRRGSDDCVFYDCGNDEFITYVESFGFITDFGTCSDISVLDSAWDIASVNLSSGYYNEHTKKEYIIFHELQKTINRAKSMLKALKKAPYFDYQEIQYTPCTYIPFCDELSDEESLLWVESIYNYKFTISDLKVISEKKVLPQEQGIQPQDSIKRLVLRREDKQNKDKNGDK